MTKINAVGNNSFTGTAKSAFRGIKNGVKNFSNTLSSNKPLVKSAKTVLPVALLATGVMSLTGFIKNKKDGTKGKIEGNAGKIAGLAFLAASIAKLAKTNIIENGVKSGLKSAGIKTATVLIGTLITGISAMFASDLFDTFMYNKKVAKRNKIIKELNNPKTEDIKVKEDKKEPEEKKEPEKDIYADQHTYIPSSQSTVSFNSFMSMIKTDSASADSHI